MLDALDPEGTEIGVLNSVCRLRGATSWRSAQETANLPGAMPNAPPLSSVGSRTRVASGGAIAATPNALRARVEFLHADVAAVDLPAARFDVVLFSWSYDE